MGRFFNEVLMKTNQIKGRISLRSPLEKLRQEFNKVGAQKENGTTLHSEESQESGIGNSIVGDKTITQYHNPVTQNRPKRTRQPRKSRVNKKGSR